MCPTPALPFLRTQQDKLKSQKKQWFRDCPSWKANISLQSKVLKSLHPNRRIRYNTNFPPSILYCISEIFYNLILSSQRQTKMSKQSFYPLKNKPSDFLMNQNAHATYKSSNSKEIHHYFSLSLQHIHLNIFTNNLAKSCNIVRRLCIINLRVHNL